MSLRPGATPSPSGGSVYLASRSPRRRELLARLGVRFSLVAVDVDESQRAGELPNRLVRRLAEEKALAAELRLSPPAPDAPLVVVGADTIVVLDGDVLGKPRDREDGLAQLARLSAREHQVLTAVAVLRGEADGSKRTESRVTRTRVWMRVLEPAECAAYWGSGEPADKAGGYAIQGVGARFVTRLDGSYSAVVGLPLDVTATLLERAGIETSLLGLGAE